MTITNESFQFLLSPFDNFTSIAKVWYWLEGLLLRLQLSSCFQLNIEALNNLLPHL